MKKYIIWIKNHVNLLKFHKCCIWCNVLIVLLNVFFFSYCTFFLKKKSYRWFLFQKKCAAWVAPQFIYFYINANQITKQFCTDCIGNAFCRHTSEFYFCAACTFARIPELSKIIKRGLVSRSVDFCFFKSKKIVYFNEVTNWQASGFRKRPKLNFIKTNRLMDNMEIK